MRFSSRRSDDDADVIRARLRALLEDRGAGGWVPDTDAGPIAHEPPRAGGPNPPTPSRVLDQPAGDPDASQSPEPAGGTGRHRAPARTTRWDPGREGARSLWIAGLVAALLLAGWTWMDRPRFEPAPATPPDETLGAVGDAPAPPVGEAARTSAVLVVSVVGLVARPGLVTLPAGARVADAVEAAGGLLPGADPATVNLAALVADGAQIAVGVPGAAPGGEAAGSGAGAGWGGRVDLNTAGAAELDALPGIGPVLAQRIVDHRTRNGPFRTVDQLDDVAGIGPATAAELAELVTV